MMEDCIRSKCKVRHKGGVEGYSDGPLSNLGTKLPSGGQWSHQWGGLLDGNQQERENNNHFHPKKAVNVFQTLPCAAHHAGCFIRSIVLGMKPRAFSILDGCFTTELVPQSLLVTFKSVFVPCTHQVSTEIRKRHRNPWTDAWCCKYRCCKPPHGCLELNLSPLQDQPVLLSIDSSLQPIIKKKMKQNNEGDEVSILKMVAHGEKIPRNI